MSCKVTVGTSEEHAEQVFIYRDLIQQYRVFIDSPWKLIDALDLPDIEAANAHALELKHSVQMLQYALLRNEVILNNPGVAAVIAQHILQGQELSVAYDMVINSDPVSYTHLDVYKRQGLICARAPGTATITARSSDNSAKYATCIVKVAYQVSFNDAIVSIYSDEDENLDPFDDPISELIVYADDELLTTAKKESNGTITACLSELVLSLATDDLLDLNNNSWEITTCLLYTSRCV